MRLRGSRRRIAHAHPVAASRSVSRSISRPRAATLAILLVVAGVALASGQLVGRGVASTAGADRAADSRRSDATLAENLDGPSTADRRVHSVGDRWLPDVRLAPPPASLTGYRWPLRYARITQSFGPSTGGTFVVAGKRFHDGIDIASFCGASIVAAHAGVVIAAGRRTDAALGWVGNLAAYQARLDQRHLWETLAIIVVIDDGNGYRSIYAHFHRIVVKVGQAVHASELLGTEGATGHASGCHLHYGLYSPEAAGRFKTDPAIARRTLIPAAEIARIDPLLVLPDPAVGFNTWGWGAGDGH